MFGPPGSGKGTQASRVAVRSASRTSPPGDMLRNEVARGTDLGREAKPIMDSGGLVPDDLVVRMIDGRLNEPDASARACCSTGSRAPCPRRSRSTRCSRRAHESVAEVISLEVPDDELKTRILKRATIEGGATTPRKGSPSVWSCTARTPAPVLEHYRAAGTRIVAINGVGDIDTITDRIMQSLQHNGAPVRSA